LQVFQLFFFQKKKILDGEEDWRLLFRETDEYKAALEIEMWKHKEEEKFRTELEEREIEVFFFLLFYF